MEEAEETLRNEVVDDQAKNKGLRSAHVKATREVSFTDILVLPSCVNVPVLLELFIQIFTTAGQNLALKNDVCWN